MIGWDDFLTYAGVFGALVISAFGVPIPEEVPIITGGVLVGNAWDNPDSGLYWWIMLPVCILGVVSCDLILYLIGRQWGTRLLKKKWVQNHLFSPEKQKQTAQHFHDYGIMTLLIARLLPGVRTWVFITSGAIRLPFRKFILADGLYAIPGVNLLFWLSYWFTDQFKRAFNRVEGNRPIVVAVILAAVAGFFLYSFLKRRVTTGDPKDLPVLGKQVASLGQHLHSSAEENKELPELRLVDPPGEEKINELKEGSPEAGTNPAN